jgi:flagellar hook-associated protein 1 FlgK
MIGLLGTLNMARQSLENAQQGVQLAGHNLANASNPAFARQRIRVQSSEPIPTAHGAQGAGAKVVAFEQIRSAVLDSAIITERSVSGFLEAKQRALIQAQAYLGQMIDRQAAAADGTTADHHGGISEGLSAFFGSLQSLSATPASIADRQMVLLHAQQLAERFNSIDSKLASLRTALNNDIPDQIKQINSSLTEIANLSNSLIQSEAGESFRDNELFDRRQAKLEELSKLADFTVTTTNGKFNLSIGGTTLINENFLVDKLSAVPDGAGLYQIKSNTAVLNSGAAAPAIPLAGGELKGTMDARDGALLTLRTDLNTMASNLISQVNSLHTAGYNLNGVNTPSLTLFTGTGAANIKLNSALSNAPEKLQMAGSANPGDNTQALALSRLATTQIAGLANRTFSDSYGYTITNFGQDLHSVEVQIADQTVVQNMLLRQRESVSGVSIDEEMTNLITFQRAYQASAKLINTMDEMLAEVIALGSTA